ncbi:AIPR family protein [Shewanella sp. 10N.286.54.B9]|uniref:AIPR family protein n=1 Tax=Shewanella sp. 10N.286.54.B9 TaxID=3229719 RepID=UPI0035528A40
MDTITKGFLKEFSANNNCSHLTEPEAFEAFCNFSVVNKETGNVNFDLFSVSTGKNAQGIDGIAVIVNNKHCTTVREIEDFVELNGYLDVNFVLIQAKTSQSFDNTKILNFLQYVKHFFDLQGESTFNTEEMENFIEIRNFIFEHSNLFINKNPSCHLYFCTLGNWQSEKTLVNLIDSNKSELIQTITFSDLEFNSIDARAIQNLYRKTKSPVEAKINFQDRTFISGIRDVEMACSGVVPFSEFKKIIIDENGQIKPVFEDNIRDYLQSDTNIVNSDIAKTIKQGDFDYFSILNNGVTVVAESVTGASSEITLRNYQIVNGCQTSHVLFENRAVPGIEDIKVPLKIIVTDNTEIKSKITRATNNQTQVGIEQLEALTEFQRRLETFYNAKEIAPLYKIYYERRTNQHYKNNVQKFRIISIEIQLKSFSAMFNDKPHEVAGHYGKLIKQMGADLFHDDDCFDLYYISALAYFILEQLYQKNYLDKTYKKYRYHLLTIFRYLVTTENTPPKNSNKKTITYSNKFESILTNEVSSYRYFKQAENLLIDTKNGINFHDRKAPERKIETDRLIRFTLENRTINSDTFDQKQSIGQLNLF